MSQVDLTLPGPAGFDLVIQRSYNSKFRINPGVPLSEYIDWFGWTGLGWTLHMGRVRNPDAATPGPVEMPDGSAHTLYRVDATTFITKEFWIYTQGSPSTLKLPNGVIYTFGQCTVIGPTGQLTPFRYATRITDAFANPIDIAYLSPQATCSVSNPASDAISSITQTTKPGQSRVVSFSSSLGQLNSMTFSGKTWTYSHSSSGGWRLLNSVQTPVGSEWTFSYCGAPTSVCSTNDLTSVTTTNGGQVAYEYATQTFKLGSNSAWNVPSRVIKKRTTGGRDIVAGVWDYLYAQGAGENQTVCTDPSGKTRTTFAGVGNYSSGVPAWSIGLPSSVERLSLGGTVMQTTVNVWIASTDAISTDDVTFGGNTDLDVRFPLQDSQTVTIAKASGVETLLTNFTYNATNFNDYGQPFRVKMTSNANGLRTTESTYQHTFTPYIRGRKTSEKTCAASTCSSSTGFPRSWAYATATGFLTSKTENGVTTAFTPTAQGDISTSTLGSTSDGRGQVTSFTYDWGREKDRTTPIFAITRVINSTGTVASETRRGFTTSFSYDNLFRLTTLTPPTIPSFPSAATTTTYDKSGVREVSTTTTRGTVSTITTVDGFGRPRLKTDAMLVKVETTYDAAGRKATVSLPYDATISPIPRDTLTYDALDRLTLLQHQDNSHVGYAFNGLAVTITDEESKITVQNWEAFGSPQSAQLVRVTEPDAGFGAINTYYTYNAEGSLLGLDYGGNIGAPGPVRSWTYYLPNEAFPGLLKSETHPESGTTTYLYDSAGNVKSRTESNGRTTTNTYDGNNRLKNVAYSDSPSYNATIGYDDSDNRTSYSDSYVQQTQAFDGVNRLTARTDAVAGRSFDTGFEYDSNDRLRRITHPAPSSRDVYYSYDNANRVTLVANAAASPSIVYANDFLYHPSGAIREFRPNGGTSPKQTFTYHPTRYWLASVNTGLRSLGYGYDDVGNVTSITESTRTGMNRSFTYDNLHRLKTATGFWGGGARTYSYDNYGNRTNDPMANTTSWLYDSGFRLTRPSSSGAATLGYNSLGNLVSDPSFTYTYTPANLIETATPVAGGSPATYRYGGDGQRVLKSQGSAKSFSIHGPSGEILSEFEEQPCGAQPILKWRKDTIYAGGRLVAWLSPDEVIPTVSFTAASSSVNEPAGTASLSIVLNTPAPLACPVSVAYSTLDGTALAGSDFVAAAGVVTFPQGSVNGATQSITITIINDTLYEAPESFTVALASPSGATIGVGGQEVTIVSEDPPPPAFSINDVAVGEGISGNTPMVFTVNVSPTPTAAIGVSFSIASTGGASAGFDYVCPACAFANGIYSGSLQFSAGETSKQILVNAIGDSAIEGDETFIVTLASPTGGAVIADDQGIGTILNDDGPIFSLTDATVTEGDSGSPTAVFTVVLSQTWTSSLTVNYQTADGTATAGSDYTAVSGTLTFAAGEASKTVSVPINPDTNIEPNETFFLNLSGASGIATISDPQGVGTILADDGNRLTINDRTTKEGNSGTKNVTFTVTLTPSVSSTVTVDYATADGTASAGSDYQSTSGTLTFASGETSKQVVVVVNGDSVQEAYERFYVQLSNASANAVVADDSGQGTITNEDGHTDRSRLMFHNFVTNRLYRWHMKNGTELDSYNWVTPWATDAGWTVGAVADFDQDGQLDYLWHNINDGRLLYWYIDGDNLKGYQFLGYTMGPPWRVATTFDSDGSGRPDIVYYNTSTGVVRIIQQDNATVLGQYDLADTVSSPWSVVAAAEVVADTDDELLLYNPATGQILYWNVTGPTRTNGALYANTQDTSVAYKLVSAKTDFNNDGLADILWHNPTPTGAFSVWFMNGLTRLGTGSFTPFSATDPVWLVVGSANIW
ncbi:MAG: hypothetical protein K1Y01_11080 [Vicinamibacteria bacterium]|nr:hypothetical protein [Vicinamibacteria bacterium]